MTDKKTIFIAFAKEDEAIRNLFTGQRIHSGTPFDFVDMSVKEPYRNEWKDKVRARIRRSDGVIVLVSSSTPKASGQHWEIACAVDEKKQIVVIWIEDGYRTKPLGTAAVPCKEWTWGNVAAFIDSL